MAEEELASVGFSVKVAAVLLLVLVVSTWWKYRKSNNGRVPRGAFPLPIIGNLHLLGELPHRALAALALKYGPLMSFRLGSALTLVVSSGDMAKEFLKTHDQLFASRAPSAAAKYLTYNCSGVVFAPYGPYWRQMRKVCVLQLLSSRRIDSFHSIREEEVSDMIRSVHSNSGRPVNIGKTVSALANAIICRMTFGRRYSDHDLTGSTGFNSMIHEHLMLCGSFNIGDFVPYLAWIDHLRGLNDRVKNIRKTEDDFFKKVIDEHAAQNDEVKETRDLVDVLLAAAADKDTDLQLTTENIKAVLFDMLAAGMDTSSTAIEWAMAEVLRNPRVLKKLQDELESVVGLGRIVRECDLPRLVYLQAVVKETLRLHPPGPLTTHPSVEDCSVLGYEIPKNTRVLVNIWAIGRNPMSWGDDAESFKPERFVEATTAGSSELVFTKNFHENFEWLPFGAGRRGCPGQQLGTLVVEFAVAQLLHCFNWSLPDEMNGQELDMTEMFNGLTLLRKHELVAIPNPRFYALHASVAHYMPSVTGVMGHQ